MTMMVVVGDDDEEEEEREEDNVTVEANELERGGVIRLQGWV